MRICNTYSKTWLTKWSSELPTNIALLSVISKVMERIINKALLTYCLTNGLFPHLQLGFLPKRSTNDALLLITQQIQNNLDKGFESRLIALDLSAAFAKVWHAGLLAKLQNCGITGHLLRWFKSYLSNIFPQVPVGDQLSSISPITSGVPPGSVLGPFLFSFSSATLLKILKITSLAMQMIVPFYLLLHHLLIEYTV